MQNFTRIIKYFGRKHNLITQVQTSEAHWVAEWYNDHLLGTDYEHVILLENHIHSAKQPTSYAEIFKDDVFFCRHFFRDNKLVNLISYEADKSLCPLIRQQLVSNTPKLDWTKIRRDSFWGNRKQPIYKYKL